MSEAWSLMDMADGGGIGDSLTPNSSFRCCFLRQSSSATAWSVLVVHARLAESEGGREERASTINE